MGAKKAILSRVSQDGLGYLMDRTTRKVLHFTFDKIPNYRGESIAQLGICKGDEVTYEADEAGRVTKVFIQTRLPRKIFAW